MFQNKLPVELNVFKTISSSGRISSIDIFRSIAIIGVVLFHFNGTLPMGFLGVDLFFVISGFLIGGILTKQFNSGESINFFKFFLQRGFKVWPSYYSFLLIGSVLAYLFYHSFAPEQIISLNDYKRYLFFYQNYTGMPFHWSFDHVWSLCIEEHFYILLPLLFIFIQKTGNKKSALITAIILVICSGIISKYVMLFYTHSKDTYSATHNRIDALAWGVLLNFVLFYKGEMLKRLKFKWLIFAAGLLLFIVSIYMELKSDSIIYHKIIFHSFLPFCFALMIAGVYYVDFSKIKILRIVAYYSYNWYLWHPVFVIIIEKYAGFGIFGISVYLVISFLFAMLFTVIVEEKALAKRNLVLSKLFDSKAKR